MYAGAWLMVCSVWEPKSGLGATHILPHTSSFVSKTSPEMSLQTAYSEGFRTGDSKI